MATHITTAQALRQLYAAPPERALRKQIAALDTHCRRFIELSPFFVLATTDKADNLDASPRGGALRSQPRRPFGATPATGAFLSGSAAPALWPSPVRPGQRTMRYGPVDLHGRPPDGSQP